MVRYRESDSRVCGVGNKEEDMRLPSYATGPKTWRERWEEKYEVSEL